MTQNEKTSEANETIVTIHVMTPEEEQQEMARLREKWTLDYNSDIYNERRMGRAEGRDKGISDMLEAMRKSGISEEQIQKVLKYQQKRND